MGFVEVVTSQKVIRFDDAGVSITPLQFCDACEDYVPYSGGRSIHIIDYPEAILWLCHKHQQ